MRVARACELCGEIMRVIGKVISGGQTGADMNSKEHEAEMRKKIGLFALADAFSIAGIAAWAASTTHARVEAATKGHGIDPISFSASCLRP